VKLQNVESLITLLATRRTEVKYRFVMAGSFFLLTPAIANQKRHDDITSGSRTEREIINVNRHQETLLGILV
jgi:hypothetical protein